MDNYLGMQRDTSNVSVNPDKGFSLRMQMRNLNDQSLSRQDSHIKEIKLQTENQYIKRKLQQQYDLLQREQDSVEKMQAELDSIMVGFQKPGRP